MSAQTPKCTISAVLSLVALLGCSGKALHDVGDVNTPTTDNGAAGGANAAAGAATAGAASSGAAGASEAGAADSIDGTWRGYIENYKNSDSTSSVEVRISDGGLAGEVVFGDATAPPPATDPEADYPPPSSTNVVSPNYYANGPYAGFVFSLISPSFTGTRLQFDVAEGELYQSWCALQTPYQDEANAGGNYYCLPNWPFTGDGTNPSGDATANCSQTDPMTKKQVSRSCGQLRLCKPGRACACTSTACTATLDTPVHFDLTLAVPTADGSVVGLDSNVHNVHLTKQ